MIDKRINKRGKMSLEVQCVYGNIALILFLIMSIILKNFNNVSYKTIHISGHEQLLLILLIFTLLYVLIKENKNKILIIGMFLIGLTYVFSITTYSPIDEAAHFDYINYIIDNHALPTVDDIIDIDVLGQVNYANIPGHTNHEAVQPPVYYISMALIGSLISNIFLRFYVIRSLGIVFLGITIMYILKCYNKLVEGNFIKDNAQVLKISIGLMLINPGLMTRMLTVSNEGMNIMLSSMVIYYLVEMLLQGYNKNKLYLLICLIILTILTKNTSMYIVAGLIGVMIYYKSIKGLSISLITIVLGLTPWLIFNYNNYNAFTGTKAHLNIVLPIVNPQSLPIALDYFIGSLSNLFTNYFIPQEIGIGNNYIGLLGFLGTSIQIVLITQIVRTIKFGSKIVSNKLKFSYKNEEKNNIIKMLFMGLISLNIISLVVASITTKVGVIIPRYLFISVLPLIMLLCYSIVEKKQTAQKVYILVLCLVLAITHVNVVSGFLSQKPNILLKLRNQGSANLNEVNNKLLSSNANISIVNGDILVETIGPDPQVYNLKMDYLSNETIIAIDIEYLSDKTGDIQLFYKNSGESFSEDKSQRFNVDNKDIFKTITIQNDKGLEEIRIDPIDDSILIIKNIVAYTSK